MKFGPVPVSDALGAILAHSIPLPNGRLRKGLTLTAADIEALQAAGRDHVVVARLDPDDIAEDDAAAQIADALVPYPHAAGFDVQNVGTGRVNIIAAHPGCVRVDASRINQINDTDPAITLATLPDWQRVDAGDMVATVKIIAYGAPKASVKRACDAALGALRLKRPQLRTAALIQTVVGARNDETLTAKGAEVTADRLSRLNVSLARTGTVPHDEAELAQALTDVVRDVDLILILTASATSDLHDTAPESLRQAGGEVEHYGMPVDPGNLLFLGRLQGKPVIGLPGCARSPALNGADWILERVICGTTPTPSDIRAMGVGGLLKEIPSRPRPRRKND